MTTGIRNLHENRLFLLLRQLPLLGTTCLGFFAFVVDLFDLLDNINWLAEKLPSLTFAAAGTIALYLAIERFSMRKETAELRQLLSAGEGFRKVPAAEISKIAARMMPDVSTLRTLGTARQDILDVDVAAKTYLHATERRVRRHSPFQYYRITSERLRDVFLGHLTLLLSAARHDIQVQLISNIETTVTYQIFDSDHVLIILDNPNVPGGRRDYAVALMSSDKEIVDGFIAHFDAAWAHHISISDPNEFRKRVIRIDESLS